MQPDEWGGGSFLEGRKREGSSTLGEVWVVLDGGRRKKGSPVVGGEVRYASSKGLASSRLPTVHHTIREKVLNPV